MESTAPPSNEGSGSHLSSTAVWAAGFFAISATLISLVAIWMQLKNYRKPLLQRFVVRILWMVPIFGLSSWISLVSLDAAFYIDAFRDIYEAFVIYCFFNLLVYYLGGERSLLVMLHGRPYTKHVWPVSLWSKEMDVGDPYTFLFIKRGILQYVYIKPILAVVTMYLKANDVYNDGSVSLWSGYFWVSFVYNLSVCTSLYCLGMFFMATQEDLEEFRPIPKFLCVKAVIFFSFWQGFAISILVSMGIIHDSEANSADNLAVAIQDFLICFEMVFASVGHWYAFSHKDYTDPDIQSARMPIYYAVRDASGIKDIIQDSLDTLRGTQFTYRTFEPSEGLATSGMSRSGRIMEGLRYTGGGAHKYWLPQTAGEGGQLDGTGAHDSLSSGQDGTSYHSSSNHDRAPSLYFGDIDEMDDGAEELYDISKRLEFGDYNFPAIDVHDPKRSKARDQRRLLKQSKKKARMYGEGGSLIGKQAYRGAEAEPLMSEQGARTKLGGPTTLSRGSGSNSPDFIPHHNSGVEKAYQPTYQQQQPQQHYHHQPSSLQAPQRPQPVSPTPLGATREGCVDDVNGYLDSIQSKNGGKKRKDSHPPSNGQASGVVTTNAASAAGGYGGYTSYQNSGPQQPRSDSPREDEQRGPMFFFL